MCKDENMSKSKRFKGKDNRVYTFIKRTFIQAGQRVREIVVKYRGKVVHTFSINKGVISTIDDFKEFAALLFPLVLKPVLTFVLAAL